MAFSKALTSKKKQQTNAPCIAVLGTGSEVGKSVITTALCRIFANQAIRVAPFKAQNMSNNSGITPEGLEMGRAQIVQAEAAKISPHVDMNPVLLKPTAEIGSQVVLLGSVIETDKPKGDEADHESLFNNACDALVRLRQEYELIIIEGAGSCAEVNLMDRDFVNFRTAAFADAPVLLVADIDRGGVFAQIIGTLQCLEQDLWARVAGFIINRFRGDIELFKDGVGWIEEKTGKPVFGVLPWYSHIQIEPEDSVVIENPGKADIKNSRRPAVAVIRLPHISNFNDFNPLLALDQLDVYFLEKVQALTDFTAVILPGSKNTRFDLNWLHASSWIQALSSYVESGGHILGICGGYQMMGKTVDDPQGLEGQPGISDGLDLLPIETVLQAPKTTTLTQFSWRGQPGTGYEIHMGQTTRTGESPLFQITHRDHRPCRGEDGCVSADLKMMGTYIHGLFDNPTILKSWLTHIGLDGIDVSASGGIEARNRQYDLLAEHFQKHIKVEDIMKLIAHQE